MNVTTVQGPAVPIIGHDIDTDRIIPARFMKEITFAKMGDYPFYDERFAENGEKRDHPFNRSEYRSARFLFANANFGCGSSREHAPQSLKRWGIQAIVAESYGEIFAGNCIMLGVPVLTASAQVMNELQSIAQRSPEAVFELDLEQLTLKCGDRKFPVEISESRRKALTEGTWDSTSMLLANAEKVKAVAAKLSYMNG